MHEWGCLRNIRKKRFNPVILHVQYEQRQRNVNACGQPMLWEAFARLMLCTGNLSNMYTMT
jgi:hypothetical protein